MNITEAPHPELQKKRFPFHHITSAWNALLKYLDGNQLPALNEEQVRDTIEAQSKRPKITLRRPVYLKGSITEIDARKAAATFLSRENGN